MNDDIELTPELMLRAYAVGIFPMAQSAAEERLAWFDPDPRGILPLDGFHLSRRMARTVRTSEFSVTADTDFAAVIDGCAGGGWDRPSTWINHRIRTLCLELHRIGYAHSIEVRHGGQLVGGLYGVALKGAFFGESMFSTARDASKIALVHLVARLIRGGFTLLDTQFATEHLAQFGAIEIPREQYRQRLAEALHRDAVFQCVVGGGRAGEIGAGEIGAAEAVSLVQSTTQIS
ncbi:MAG: leucyl/phenylalanyl-tRNA--protein transferase [Rhodospirillales bacterium]|nr:leucyl/phenylalanyl-tRNA--protein transferase [Rhodospirillales bacterium]